MSVNLEQSLTFYWSFRKKDVHLVLGKKIKPGGELLLRSIPVFLLDECVNKEMGAGVVGPELKKKRLAFGEAKRADFLADKS